MRPTVHLAGTEMRALLALRCVIGNDLFQAPDAILGEEMGSPESCRPKTSCAPNPTGVPVTGPSYGGVKCIGKSEFFNHVYKVMIDFIDIGKASAQNDDVRIPGDPIPTAPFFRQLILGSQNQIADGT